MRAKKGALRYFQAARDAGLAEDQIIRFVEADYVALPKLLPFHAAAREADDKSKPNDIMLAGTRNAAKSHAVFAQTALDDCQRIPGLKVLVLRKVMKAAGESVEDLVTKILHNTPHEFKSGKVYFPNGSRIVIGGFLYEKQIDNYLGIEYDLLMLEEATQISEKKKNLILGSIRSSVPGWRTRKYYTTNADGIGVQWVKNMFVFPSRQKKEKLTRFFQASYKDNPFCDEDYCRYLEGLKGALGKAWRECDWDAFEGMAFPTWQHDLHVVEEPFEIPGWWPRWRAVDWGTAKPFCCLYFTKNPDLGRTFVNREVYQEGLTDKQQACLIVENTSPEEKIMHTFADPSLWSKKNVNDEWYTTADVYRQNGVPLTPGNNDRLAGKRVVDGMLGLLPDGIPELQVFSNCYHLIEQMENLPRDPLHPEDVDTDAEDHAYDTLRYGLTSKIVHQAKKEKKVDRDKERKQFAKLMEAYRL